MKPEQLSRLYNMLKATKAICTTGMELPVAYLQMLTYIALYENKGPLYTSDIMHELGWNAEKMHRAYIAMQAYISRTVARKEGVRGPAYIYHLTEAGRAALCNVNIYLT